MEAAMRPLNLPMIAFHDARRQFDAAYFTESSRAVIYRRGRVKSTLGCVARDTRANINGTGLNLALLYRHTRRYLNANGEPHRRSVGRLRKPE